MKLRIEYIYVNGGSGWMHFGSGVMVTGNGSSLTPDALSGLCGKAANSAEFWNFSELGRKWTLCDFDSEGVILGPY